MLCETGYPLSAKRQFWGTRLNYLLQRTRREGSVPVLSIATDAKSRTEKPRICIKGTHGNRHLISVQHHTNTLETKLQQFFAAWLLFFLKISGYFLDIVPQERRRKMYKMYKNLKIRKNQLFLASIALNLNVYCGILSIISR